MNGRAFAIAFLLVVAGLFRLQLRAVEPGSSGDLTQMPLRLGPWTSEGEMPFDAAVLSILKPDAYVNRVYRQQEMVAGVYIGYHRSQTYGSTIHSPMSCLPGIGWQPVTTDRIELGTGSAKRVVVEKAEQRQLVIYWYQSLKRVEGNEYLNKLQLVADAFTSRRNDAALVRIIVPMAGVTEQQEKATEVALSLANLVEPKVRQLLFAHEVSSRP